MIRFLTIVFILLQLLLFVPKNVFASDILGPWTEDSPLTQTIAGHLSFSYNNFLYVIGGATSDDFSTIQRLDSSTVGIDRVEYG